ncbi:MAG: hypothetical protein H7066_14650 [Cytophagaceae bacterium]|nr:hypothetical protein [Gemmatimonadaceae bacterium]
MRVLVRQVLQLIVISLAAFAPPPLRAQDAVDRALTLQRAPSSVRIDGDVSGSEWADIPPLVLTMYRPTAGLPPTDSSHVRVAYTADGIVASGRFWTPTAADVRGNSLYRDRTGSDDEFRLMLDTFDDRDNAVHFIATPLGNRIDFATAGDGQAMNFDWNAQWEAQARRLPDGWSVEMYIPFASLRFRSDSGRVRMRLLVARWSVARQELVTFPAVSPTFANAPMRSSLAQPVELPGVVARKPLLISPYALTGSRSLAQLNTSGAAWRMDRADRAEIGGDLKYGLASDMTLDATINTDFAEVEADDQQVNLSRFSLFFPEKRQFFQERFGTFAYNMGLGDNARVFHSRRIGLDNAGNPLRIYGGARLVGRTGPWDIGALAMQAEHASGTGSEHFGVYRVRRTLGDPQSFLGAITTVRTGHGAMNAVYGVDAQVRTLRNDFLTLQWAQSADDAIVERGRSGGMARVAYERRSDAGLVYSVVGRWIGKDHLPALGFVPRRDYASAQANVRYGWYPGAGRTFRYIQPSLFVVAHRRNRDHVMESAFANGFLNFETKTGIGGFVRYGLAREILPAPLPLGQGITVPAGRYDTESLLANVGLAPRWPLRASIGAEVAGLYDGRSTSVSLSPTWNVSSHAELGADLTRQRVRFASRNQVLHADLARVRVRLAANTKASLNTYLQYNRVSEQFAGNIRFRYNFREGRDLYVTFNDRLNSDRDRFTVEGAPELPLHAERSVAVKFSTVFIR